MSKLVTRLRKDPWAKDVTKVLNCLATVIQQAALAIQSICRNAVEKMVSACLHSHLPSLPL